MMVLRSALAAALLLPLPLAAASRWQNVTVYHVHPSSNLHGDLRDMNSGDQAGDVRAPCTTTALTRHHHPRRWSLSRRCCQPRLLLQLLLPAPLASTAGESLTACGRACFVQMFFASRDRWLPLACRNDTGFEEPGECHMTEISDPQHLAISAVVVEMDTERTGEFRACNLVQSPSINFPKPTNYSCSEGHHGGHGHRPSPPPPPSQPCTNYSTEDACNSYHSSGRHCKWTGSSCYSYGCSNLTIAECRCTKRGSQYDPSCASSSHGGSGGHFGSQACLLSPDGDSCEADTTTLGTATVRDFFGPGRSPSSREDKVAPWDWWKQGLVRHFGAGLWWSTERIGECVAHGVPAGCSWRVVKEIKRVGKLCADARCAGPPHLPLSTARPYHCMAGACALGVD